MVRFISLSSGSNGNSYYIGNDRFGFLIDSGIGPRTIKKRLAEHGIAMDSVKFVLVTHEHIDHIKSLGAVVQRFGVNVYATEKLHRILDGHFCTRGKLKGYVKTCEPYKRVEMQDMAFIPFPVPHDARDTVGYFIEIDGIRFTLVTDAGDITDDIIKYGSMANVLILESNYDLDMLLGGDYSPDLKLRITAGSGHLSNDQAASVVKRIYNRGLSAIFLCHLSENNNTPERASNAIANALKEIGIKPDRGLILEPLPRRRSSAMFTF